jgi:hypothetical protein
MQYYYANLTRAFRHFYRPRTHLVIPITNAHFSGEMRHRVGNLAEEGVRRCGRLLTSSDEWYLQAVERPNGTGIWEVKKRVPYCPL